MRFFVPLAALILQLPPTTNTQAPASIEGMVVDNQMRPVAGAEVSSYWELPPLAYRANQVPRTNTDSAGKFVIPNLAPGGYRIGVNAPGYVFQTYGAKTVGVGSSARGMVISLAPGQSVREITVRLTAASTISGRVTASNGIPLSGMDVHALRVAYDSSGSKTLVSDSGSQTDDRGEYRLTGMGPGRYYVRAETPYFSTNQNEVLQRMGRPPVSSGFYATTYYPGSGDFSAATPVEVRESEKVQDINFVLPRLQTFRIRGHLLDVNGAPPARPASDAKDKPPIRPMLGLLPIQPDYVGSTSMSVVPYCGTSRTCENPGGAFELTDVAPGFYWLTGQISEPLTEAQRQIMQTPGADPSSFPQPQRAVAAVRVTNSDIDGVELRFYPKLSISGRALIDDSSLSTLSGVDSIRIEFRQSYAGSLGPIQNAALDPQGRFSTGNLLPGEYRVDVRGLPQQAFLVEARLGDRDVSNDLIRILAPQSDELSIRLSAKSGRVGGVVVDSSSKPAANATVVLVPVQDSKRPDRYKTTTALSDGRFEIEGLAPGDYTAFSWQAIEDYSWFDPNILRQYESKGKLVHVVASSNEELQLTQIPTSAN
ncbi:MAG TPA: carboxypeptidase-like regulatory domain-containing protein [Terriglobia bacterium]|nr:carboxypeptidase-like regulatory domain-containing protein [Terriglobia bacterium]